MFGAYVKVVCDALPKNAPYINPKFILFGNIKKLYLRKGPGHGVYICVRACMLVHAPALMYEDDHSHIVSLILHLASPLSILGTPKWSYSNIYDLIQGAVNYISKRKTCHCITAVTDHATNTTNASLESRYGIESSKTLPINA
jgi:hypothetical protein